MADLLYVFAVLVGALALIGAVVGISFGIGCVVVVAEAWMTSTLDERAARRRAEGGWDG
jgi:hypothetical protein